MNKKLSNEPPKNLKKNSDCSLSSNSGKKLVPATWRQISRCRPMPEPGFRSQASPAGSLFFTFIQRTIPPAAPRKRSNLIACGRIQKKAGAAILGVSPDPVASHAKFKAKHKLELALASDESKAMLEAYGVWAEKSMYGRKYMGVERTTFLIGRDCKIAVVWNKVSVPGHAEAVLAAVKAL